VKKKRKRHGIPSKNLIRGSRIHKSSAASFSIALAALSMHAKHSQRYPRAAILQGGGCTGQGITAVSTAVDDLCGLTIFKWVLFAGQSVWWDFFDRGVKWIMKNLGYSQIH